MIPAASLHGAPQDQGEANRASLIDEEIERVLGAPAPYRDGSSYADLSAKVVDPGLADRQVRLRRVVTYVMAGALGLLVIAGMCGAVRRPHGPDSISNATAMSLEAVPSIATERSAAEVPAPPSDNKGLTAELSPAIVATSVDAPPAHARVVATPSVLPSITSQRASVSKPVRAKVVPQQKIRNLALGPRAP